MFCPNCGNQNDMGVKFCTKCGNNLDNNQIPNNGMVQMQNQTMNNNQFNPNNNTQFNQYNNNNSYVAPAYGNQSNSSGKTLAILSIVLPAIGIFFYIFIGLTVYIAIILASLGIAFARKSEMSYPSLAKTGKILSWILIVIAVIMYILLLTGTIQPI